MEKPCKCRTKTKKIIQEYSQWEGFVCTAGLNETAKMVLGYCTNRLVCQMSTQQTIKISCTTNIPLTRRHHTYATWGSQTWIKPAPSEGNELVLEERWWCKEVVYSIDSTVGSNIHLKPSELWTSNTAIASMQSSIRLWHVKQQLAWFTR